MKGPRPLTGYIFTVRHGSAGEAMVTAPSGRVEFMGFWQFIRFMFTASWAGHKVEWRDD